MNEKIDFDNHIPYYIQLMDILKEKIDKKEWNPGDQMPGENELCQTYQISRTVVRQALKELEIAGIVNRRKGKGTFVAPPKISEGLMQKVTGFYQDMTERGLNPNSKVLHNRVVPCNEKVAEYLGVEPGSEVIDIKRLRYVNGEPIQLVTTYIPFELCPALVDADLTDESLYKFLEKESGIQIEKSRRYIEAVPANENEAHLLQINRGVPLMMLDSISYASNGKPVEYYHALHRGDRSRFEVELVAFHDTDKSS